LAGWAVATASLALVATGLGFWAASGFRPLPAVFAVSPALIASSLIQATAFVLFGLLLTHRLPVHRIGWTFAALGLLSGLRTFGWGVATSATSGATVGYPFDPATVVWLTTWASITGSGLATTFLLLTFPDGRLLGSRWRAAAAVAAGGAIVLAVALALRPGPVVLIEAFRNPIDLGASAAAPLRLLEALGGMATVAGTLAGVWSMRHRYIGGNATERLQLRWFAWAAGILAVPATVFFMLRGFVPGSIASEFVGVALFLALTLLTLAATLAVLRYGLYSIDRIISRTLAYGALIAILAGVYATSMSVIQRLFLVVAGSESDAAVAVTTLILVTVTTPIQRRIDGFTSKRLEAAKRADGGDPSAAVPAAAATGADNLEIRALAERVARLEQRAAEGRTPAAGRARHRRQRERR
jgi:hypothetical protein